jgi:hypothetical protein
MGTSVAVLHIPEDRCVRLLVKKLGRSMPESVIREELESLDMNVQGVTQLRSGRRDQDPAKDRPPAPHFIMSVTRGPEVSKVGALTELFALRVSAESYVAPKGPSQCKRFGKYAAKLRIRTLVRRLWGLPPIRWMLCLAGTASLLRLRGKPHGELPCMC